jgi:putative colanic acid biosynthesis acetyltransferase WcaB
MSNFLTYILQDWQINRETSLKSRFVLIMFRTAHLLGRSPLPFSLFPFVYQILVEWILGIELPWDTQIGANLKLQHGLALVVNHETIIGENCIIRHSTTIGNKKSKDGSYSASPKIGNNVDIGSNVVILGAITVGNSAIIGAGSVVVKDVPEGAVVAGNPARIIRFVNEKPSSKVDKVLDHSEFISDTACN